MIVPEPQREMLEQILPKLKTDDRLLGVAIGGSYLSREMDEYSDLDLIIVVDDLHYEQVLKERQLLANRLGKLLAAFTGEHVGEPRLLIGRGELFEVIDFLSFLRGQVLAPLAKVQAGLLPRGVRNLEREIPFHLNDFRQTLPAKHDQKEIGRSLQHTIHFYCQLRAALKMPKLVVRSQAEAASTKYLQTIIDSFK